MPHASATSLRRSRLALGLSQEQLARRLGVSFVTVNRWERGRTRPRGAALAQLEAVGILVDGPARSLAGRTAPTSGEARLDGRQQRLLDRLSVFPASFGLPAAEAVAGSTEGSAGASVIVDLAALVGASLVDARTSASGQRYELVERVRVASRERLAAGTDRGELAWTAFTAWCLAFAREAEQGMAGREQAAWLQAAALEARSVEAAIRRSIEVGDAATALEICAAFWRYWHSTSDAAGLALVRAALSLRGAPRAARGRALFGAGVLARHRGDFGAATRFLTEHLAIVRDGGDSRSIAEAHNSLAGALHLAGQSGRARDLLLASLDWWERTGDRRGVASALSNLGVLASDARDMRAAREFGEQALALRLALGHRESIAISIENLATVALQSGDGEDATTLFREALHRYADLGEQDGVADALDGLGAVLPSGLAVQLIAAADAIRERTGVPRTATQQARHEARLTEFRAAVGPAAFLRLWRSGAELSLDAAVALAGPISPGQSMSARRLHRRLTAREREVLAHVVQGSTAKEIAARLGLSPRTVERHLANTYAKVGARGRADAIAFGVRVGLADSPTLGR